MVISKLDEEDNMSLQRKVSTKELELALSQCNSNKAPEPDGLNAGTLKILWPQIHKEMLNLIDHFMETGQLPGDINSSFITLIPKVNNPWLVKDFRPIVLLIVL